MLGVHPLNAGWGVGAHVVHCLARRVGSASVMVVRHDT